MDERFKSAVVDPVATPGPKARTFRVLALMEATTLTGPAKNLIQFAHAAGESRTHLPRAQFCVVAFVRGDQKTNGFLDAMRAADIELELVRERFVYDPSVIAQLRRIVARRQPDIIQTHNIKSHFLTRVAGFKRGRRWIAFQHGYTSTDLKMLAYNQLDRWTLRNADHIVTVCGEFARRLHAWGIPPARISVRHNMIEPFVRASDDEVVALRERLGIRPEEPVLFTAGRLSREKGHVDLVNAIERLRSLYAAPVRVVIAGEGPARPNLEKLITECDLGSTILLVGHQTNLRPYYSLSDIFVLPSHSEGSPNALLEAMAAGIPCVATSVGGVPEIASNGKNALLVPKGDVMAMAHALTRLLQDDGLRERLGTAARDQAEKYSTAAYCQSLLSLYGRVLF